jgi:uncharacterized protein (DUF58 family)
MSDSTNEGNNVRRPAADSSSSERVYQPIRTRRIPPTLQGPPPIPPAWEKPPPLPGKAKKRRSVLTPSELERFGDLLVFARSTVEGSFVGKHKSPYRGSSVEFTDYKEYVAGDDPKRIDWRAFGRSRRLFVRQFEAETDMVIYLMVDVSASMNYAGAGHDTKFFLAARIAAALAYLMIHQGDKAALALFADKLSLFLPPGGTRRHLHNLVNELEMVQPASRTGIAKALSECDVLFRKRGRLVLLSDFWDDTELTLEALSRFLHRKYEILLLHIVHPDELDLPAVAAARFQDMETNDEVRVEPEEIRTAYRESVCRRADALAREANNRRINYSLVSTTRPYLDAIEAYLGFRSTNTLSSR